MKKRILEHVCVFFFFFFFCMLENESMIRAFPVECPYAYENHAKHHFMLEMMSGKVAISGYAMSNKVVLFITNSLK